MIRLLQESDKSDITARLINLGYNISGCKVDWVDSGGSYKIVSGSQKYKYLALEYDSDDETMYIDFEPLDGGSEEVEESYPMPEKMTECILRWNELLKA